MLQRRRISFINATEEEDIVYLCYRGGGYRLLMLQRRRISFINATEEEDIVY